VCDMTDLPRSEYLEYRNSQSDYQQVIINLFLQV
jgi:hypothetical protein